jgi:hypothetical protein
LVICIEADDILVEGTCVGADGFARRPGDVLKGGGQTKEDGQQAEEEAWEGEMEMEGRR